VLGPRARLTPAAKGGGEISVQNSGGKNPPVVRQATGAGGARPTLNGKKSFFFIRAAAAQRSREIIDRSTA